MAANQDLLLDKFRPLGFGLGLRGQHYQSIISNKPNIDWFEIITENYMIDGGAHLNSLAKIRQDYPIVMHGVSLSVGSSEKLNLEYLKKLKFLIKEFKPEWISDHICWTGINGINTHDLLPLPYTEESLKNIVNKVKQVQDYLGQAILLENPSTYIEFPENSMPEWEFINRLSEQANCFILLDINNIFVSAHNNNFSAKEYLNAINKDSVKQFHLAGHIREDNYLIDTHGTNVMPDVWDLYKNAIKRFGLVATLIERDDNIPPLEELIKELEFAKKISAESLN